MRVFVDTSALYAAMVRSDCKHKQAAATLAELLERRAELWTTSYVVLEMTALLQARVGLDAVRRFQHEFVPVIAVHWVEQKLHERAFRRLELRNRRDLSLVDCTSFVFSEEAGIGTVFCYDDHFADEGFAVLNEAADIS